MINHIGTENWIVAIQNESLFFPPKSRHSVKKKEY